MLTAFGASIVETPLIIDDFRGNRLPMSSWRRTVMFFYQAWKYSPCLQSGTFPVSKFTN